MLVGIKQAQKRMEELVAVALAGEEVVFIRWGKPVAQLVLLTEEEKRQRQLQAGA